MRVVEIAERTIPLSRYAEAAIAPPALDTSAVAVRIDAPDGPTVGYGFGSIGRFAQRGLTLERFAPRLLAADPSHLVDDAGELDPVRAWAVMLAGEKAGGHGERCVAVGALDVALWDLAAKRAELPLAQLLARRFGDGTVLDRVAAYASGGYRYPHDDRERLRDELLRMVDAGYRRVKIKIGAGSFDDDRRRIALAQEVAGPDRVAVDAMNAYASGEAVRVAGALRDAGLWWLEDICDPHDFATQRTVAERYPGALAVGEPLFSRQEAALLADFGGMRSERDILLFDPVHCYGITGFVQVLETLLARGWPRAAFWPHGGHLLTLHVVAGLRLGGTEVNPFAFAPFGGLGDEDVVDDGEVRVACDPGIGFERRAALRTLFTSLFGAG